MCDKLFLGPSKISTILACQINYLTSPLSMTWRHLKPFLNICCVKAHANGPNIVGQQHPTLLGPTMLWLVASVCMEPQQCWHLLALHAHSLKPVKHLGQCKRTQHCWPTSPNNVGSCWHLLRPFALAFMKQVTEKLARMHVFSWVIWFYKGQALFHIQLRLIKWLDLNF